ncbi:MAG: carbon storage regulator CsrA [Planctomycetales bacterium]
MLVLTRKKNQRIRIGDDIEITVLEVHGDRVKLGFSGPPHVPIHREEVARRIRDAVGSGAGSGALVGAP